MSNGKSVENASIKLSNTQNATLTDSVGAYSFSNLQAGNYILVVTRVGFSAAVKRLTLQNTEQLLLNIQLDELQNDLNEVVVTDRKSVV